jgi:uncharacterized LabA/DUF88 family protein
VSNDRLKIAVFIDFDNIEIGVKNSLGGIFDVGVVLEAVKERGEVVTKVAYGDWTRATDYGRSMSQHAVHMVQRNLTPGGDKNGADINLALDALEMAFTHNHINAFVIVGGDSDFITLVEKLKQYDRKVFVVGGRSFTSQVMQKNCTEFMAYEDILGITGRGRHTGGRPRSLTDVAVAMPLLRRAIKLLADREMTPQLGLLKSTLLQLDSSFSERAYGAGSFRDFVEKLAKAGHVAIRGADRSFYVELREAGEPGTALQPLRPAAPEPAEGRSARDGRHRGHRPDARPDHPVGDAPPAPTDAAPEAPTATPAVEAAPVEGGERLGPNDGYRVMLQAFSREGVAPRFPMYVRQVKQFIKTLDETFDERRYGFAGILDAVRFGQREGLFRLDRDRQGGVRVHPGAHYPTLTKASETVPQPDALAAGDHPQDGLLPLDFSPAAAAALRPEPQPGTPEPLDLDLAAAPSAPATEEAPPSPSGEDSSAPEAAPARAPRAPARKRTVARPSTRTKKAATPAAAPKKRVSRPRAKKA